MSENKINFNTLVSQIEYTNEVLQNNARLVINRHVTVKAWLTGYYIVEYEQNGSDRAKYGEKLIIELAKRLKTNGDNKCSKRSLELYRTFYITYRTLFEPIQQYIVKNFSIVQSPIAQLENYGILMCSEVGQEMAEYTLLDTDEDIFISKYELSIPSKERMTEFLRKENEELASKEDNK